MRWSINWVALAVEVAVVTAQSGTHAPNTGASVVNPDPCAVISSRAVSYISASPKGRSNSDHMGINASTDLDYSYHRSPQTVRSLRMPKECAVRPRQKC